MTGEIGENLPLMKISCYMVQKYLFVQKLVYGLVKLHNLLSPELAAIPPPVSLQQATDTDSEKKSDEQDGQLFY